MPAGAGDAQPQRHICVCYSASGGNNWVVLRPLSPILRSAHWRAEPHLLQRQLCTDLDQKTDLGRRVLSRFAESRRSCFTLMVHLKEEKPKRVDVCVCAAAASRATLSLPSRRQQEPLGMGLVCNTDGCSLPLQPLHWDTVEKPTSGNH